MNRSATFELTLTRFIRAPREKVYDAFVTEAGMKAWMCPRGMTLPEMKLDARVGGGFRLVMRAKDGDQFTAQAQYRELARPERLVYTWQWVGEGMPNVETLITVTLAARDGGTEVRMTHSGFPDEALCESHKEGWGSCLNRLTDKLDPDGTAASVSLQGDPRSTYTRTARIGLAEKGIKYRMRQCGPHTPEILAVHPWGRIPVFCDGDVRLFETSAILRYVEEAFPGPTLLPQNIRDRAVAEQWVSAINSYFYDLAVRRYVLQYVLKKEDRGVLEAAAKELPAVLGHFERGYTRPFLAGQNATLPDYFLAPIVGYLDMFPESKAALAGCPRLMRAHAAMTARASWKETQL
ncbi:MAG: SRPBCC domain-containing protein [Betaproteobacteria bacterium]|nr:SRPBCC domain-containing protein [Betaproteobacteria bacterium]